MRLSKYAKRLGIKYKTAWQHFDKGLIPGAYQIKTGTIIVPDEIFDEKSDKPLSIAIYARVSSHDNKDNLDRQVDRLSDYCASKGWQVSKIIKEIASGVNDNRKKFSKLLCDKDIDVIVVEHKDRATRFGFNYISCLLESQGRKIEVMNLADNGRDDLMQDLIAIIYSFSARMYGQRRAKNKADKIKAALEDG